MKKSVSDKLIKYFFLISFIVIGILYWFNLIAMHYIFGVISLLLIFSLYIISSSKIIKTHKKQIINLSINGATIIIVIISHLLISNKPYSFDYEYIDGGIKITGYRRKISNNYGEFYIEIPSYINGKKVKSIGSRAFYGSSDFYEIIIPDTVEIIEDEAFLKSNIQYITLPNSVEYIGDKAFAYTNISYVSIPSSVNYIGFEAFKFSADVITVETNVTISDWAINWHQNSSYVYYNSNKIEVFDGVVYVLHNDKTSTVSRIYKSYSKIKILEKINYNNEDYIVTTIDHGAGYQTNFEEISIPYTINTIRSNAFSLNKNLKNIFIPSSVKYMEESVFVGCMNLVIYVEHNEKPDGWSNDWNIENIEVKWNVNLDA